MNWNIIADHSYEETGQASFKMLKTSSKRLTSHTNIKNPRIKLTKAQFGENISESPYAQVQAISKLRNNTSAKLKSLQKSNSSSLNTSNPPTQPKTKSLVPHSSIHTKEFVKSLRQKFFTQNLNPQKSSSKLIEEKLFETLKRIKEKQMATTQFEAFQTAFEEIIQTDEVYGGVLKRIKEAYEQKIKYEQIDVSKEVIEKLKDEVKEFREKAERNKKEKKFLLKKIEKLSRENVENCRNLESLENKYIELQAKIADLSNVELDTVKTDEMTWKFLIAENKHLMNLCEDLKNDHKLMSKKEKKLVRLVVALKERGYPVEEVYQKDVFKPQTLTCDEPVEDNSENEDLLSNRPNPTQKPSIIPTLPLHDLQTSEKTSNSSSNSQS